MDRFVTVLRWIARAMGAALLVEIAAFAIGEGMPIPFRGSLPENLLTIAFLAMMIGQIIAWRWEGLGSLSILGGFGLFAVLGNHQ